MVSLLLVLALSVSADTLWLEWGGPGRDFNVPDAALASSWPREGPPRLWSRDLGDGYSAVLADGADPRNGDLLWSHEHKTDFAVNVATPAWADGNVLVVASAYGTGARGLKLQRQGGKTTVTELWFNPKLRVHHGNLIQIGEYVFGSSGDFGPAPVTAVHVATGLVAWQDRHFPK